MCFSYLTSSFFQCTPEILAGEVTSSKASLRTETLSAVSRGVVFPQ